MRQAGACVLRFVVAQPLFLWSPSTAQPRFAFRGPAVPGSPCGAGPRTSSSAGAGVRRGVSSWTTYTKPALVAAANVLPSADLVQPKTTVSSARSVRLGGDSRRAYQAMSLTTSSVRLNETIGSVAGAVRHSVSDWPLLNMRPHIRVCTLAHGWSATGAVWGGPRTRSRSGS